MPPNKHWSSLSKIFAGLLAVATLVGGLAAIATFLPRVTIDAAGPADLTNPFPPSIIIANGLIPLVRVGFSIRPCIIWVEVHSPIIGRDQCNGEAGASGFSVTEPGWQNHELRTDEKWTITNIAGPIKVSKLEAADVSVDITYWPWLVPELWFAPRRIEVRLATERRPDGTLVWGYRPID